MLMNSNPSVRPKILGLCDGRVIHPGAWNACSYTTNRMADWLILKTDPSSSINRVRRNDKRVEGGIHQYAQKPMVFRVLM